jgi:hypothetical protein
VNPYTQHICFTPTAFSTATLWQFLQLGLIFSSTYLGCWLGLKLIGFLGELGEAVLERVRAKATRDDAAATDDGPTSSTP